MNVARFDRNGAGAVDGISESFFLAIQGAEKRNEGAGEVAIQHAVEIAAFES